MIFENHKITSNLSKKIESIIYFKDINPGHSIERVVPTGHVFLIFELDDFERFVYDNKTLKPIGSYTKVWISGMHRNYISISAHDNSEMFVIQFKPGGAFPFLHFPLYEVDDRVISGEEVFGQEILEFRNKILKANDAKSKFRVAEEWLLDRCKKTKPVSPELLNFIVRVQNSPAANLKEIIGTYPNTQKQLIKHFKTHVGLTPKLYQRIMRFNEILHKINNKNNTSWTEIAYSCGFSDQSHFIKEFKLFCGFNPREFIREFTESETNFFPLDKKG